MDRAAHIKDGSELVQLDVVKNNAYATARDWFRDYDGRPKVMWQR